MKFLVPPNQYYGINMLVEAGFFWVDRLSSCILPHILVAESGKASEIQIENLARDVNLMELERSMDFQLKVPMVPGEFVISPPRFINNVPVHLLLSRSLEMKLVLFTCPARITAVSLHMLCKRQIFCNGLKILEEENIDFEMTKAFGHAIYLDLVGPPLTGVLDIRMWDISFKSVDVRKKFEILEFELNPRLDPAFIKETSHSPMKYLHKMKFYVEFEKRVLAYAETRPETYHISLKPNEVG